MEWMRQQNICLETKNCCCCCRKGGIDSLKLFNGIFKKVRRKCDKRKRNTDLKFFVIKKLIETDETKWFD